jgi:hypothetical protein
MKRMKHSIRASRRRALALPGTILAIVCLCLTAAVGPAQAMNGNVPDNRPATGAGEITAMYWHGLNRDPDPAGFAQYMSFVNQDCRWGVLSGSFQILNSAEAHDVWNNNPQTLAGMLYAALLNRPPDPGGLAAYTAAIAQRGLPWATAAMMSSDEYNNRLNAICPHPNDNATMYAWYNAKSFATSVLFHNAASEALVCGLGTAYSKIDYVLKDAETPLGQLLGDAISVENWIVDNFSLDGSCGAMVAYVKAGLAVIETIGGNQANPVFIEFTVGGKSIITGQREFTIRVGPDPTHWIGYSGKGW